jgi:hypothetical protein
MKMNIVMTLQWTATRSNRGDDATTDYQIGDEDGQIDGAANSALATRFDPATAWG